MNVNQLPGIKNLFYTPPSKIQNIFGILNFKDFKTFSTIIFQKSSYGYQFIFLSMINNVQVSVPLNLKLLKL
jgi:hypothetical protein